MRKTTITRQLFGVFATALLLLLGACSPPAAVVSSERLTGTGTSSNDATTTVETPVPAGDAAITPTPPAEPSPASAGRTPEPPQPTQTPLVIPTPSDDKNQPVFRQARTDGDSRGNPQLLEFVSGTALIGGELSAYTDRLDAFSLAVPADVGELSVGWKCTDYAAEDERPVLLTVQQASAVLAEFRCESPVTNGSAVVRLGGTDQLLVVADIGSTAVDPAANVFVEYELSIRGTAGTTASDDADDAPSSPPTPTTNGPTSTPVDRQPTPTAAAEATSTPEPTATTEPTSTPEPTTEPTSTPEPTAEPTPTPSPRTGGAATPTPEATATPQPTPAPEATPTATPEPTATAVPTPDPNTESALDDDNGEADGQGSSPTNGTVAPPDGDSRSNPRTINDEDFLIGSVSAPQGDGDDWSSFSVGPDDPTLLVAGVLCGNFSSSDGSGRLALTVYEGSTAIAEFVCTSGVSEDLGPVSFQPGLTYVVGVQFSGVGYSDWVFIIADDD